MVNRTIAPAFAKEFKFDLPSPQLHKLRNGVDLIYLDEVQQDVVKIEVIFKAGKWYESKVGVSHFTSQMLEKGTHNKSSKQIAEIFDLYGAQLEINSGLDFVSASLYTLSKTLDSVFPIFIEVLTQPSFAEEELALLKTIFKQNLKINNEKTSYVASKIIRKNIFGGHHPYGISIEEADVDQITVNDLSVYFRGNFNPFEVYITGNVPSKLNLIDDLLGGISIKKHVLKRVEMAVSAPFSKNINKEDNTQSTIRLGKRTISRSHQDYPKLFLLNHILGGYFGSRLMKNIREEKGLTYGIYSSINSFLNDAMLSIGADVNKDKVDVAFAEITNELLALKETQVSDTELQAARNHLLGSLQLEVANPFSVTEKIKGMRLNGLPGNYYQRLFEEISSLSSKELLSIANIYFNTDSFYRVSVG